MSSKYSNYFLHIILVIFVGWLIFIACRFAAFDRTPMFWDYANHVFFALNYYREFFITHDLQKAFFTYYDTYPPLMNWIFALLIRTLGFSKGTIIILNMTFLGVLLSAVYLYTKNHFDRLAACMSTIFALGITVFILQPYWFYNNLYQYSLDFPLLVTTFVAYCVIRHIVQKQQYSLQSGLLIGIVTGIALMTKWTALTLLAFPLLYYSGAALKHNKYGAVGTLLLTGLISCGWWYLLHYHQLLTDWWDRTHLPMHINFFPLSVYTHPPLTHNSLFLLGVLTIPVIPILYSIIRKRATIVHAASHPLRYIPYKWEISNVAVSLLFFILFPAHDLRFLYPSLFLLGMVTLWHIIPLTSSIRRGGLTIGIILFTALSIWIFQPTLSTKTYAMNLIRTYIQHHNDDTYGTFFEASMVTFNPDTEAELFAEFNILHQRHLSYHSLNDLPNLASCDEHHPGQTLFVMSSNDPTDNYYMFSKLCSDAFRAQYQYVTSEHAADGDVQIYTYKPGNQIN